MSKTIRRNGRIGKENRRKVQCVSRLLPGVLSVIDRLYGATPSESRGFGPLELDKYLGKFEIEDVLYFALNTSSSPKRFGNHSLSAPLKAVRTIGGAMRWSTGIALIVDPEDEVLGILRTALQSSEYVVLHATTGNEALAVLSRLKFPIDLAIIDLELPSDNGLVINLLTILGSKKTTKIIVKTSGQGKPFLESVHCDIDAIVLKPISEEQLVKTVRETLNGLSNGSAGMTAGTAA